jgi:hypothetical protein
MSDVTRPLSTLGQSDPHAASPLLPLVYEEPRKLAAQRLAQEQPGQTIQPTALVHEAYLRQGPAACSATFFRSPVGTIREWRFVENLALEGCHADSDGQRT